jgi:hypothetical protein
VSVVGPARSNAVVALQRVGEPRATQRLGVESFGRQIEDGEVGGVRRLDVFVADLLRLVAQRLERLGRRFDGDRVGSSCASTSRW